MNKYKDKVILITGGTGSFGYSFLSFLKGKDFKEVRVYSRDELKQEQMRHALSDSRIKFYIGDVRDESSVRKAMKGVDYVFHAAALKQVPSCEFFPVEAIQTNALGSKNVVEAAIDCGVEKLVCLSTDKAVYPINSMGMTKALMEKVAQSYARQLTDSDTVVSIVRYGNIMCSRGSVIPLFINQLKDNKPLTITEPEMTRFLLTLEDAITLVDFAFHNGQQGDILVKKSPASTILELANAILKLFESDVGVKNIGVRHGEKLYETLVSREELARSVDEGGYYKIFMDDRGLNYNLYFTEGNTKEPLVDDYTSHNADRLSIDQIIAMLLKLPEVHAHLES